MSPDHFTELAEVQSGWCSWSWAVGLDMSHSRAALSPSSDCLQKCRGKVERGLGLEEGKKRAGPRVLGRGLGVQGGEWQVRPAMHSDPPTPKPSSAPRPVWLHLQSQAVRRHRETARTQVALSWEVCLVDPLQVLPGKHCCCASGPPVMSPLCQGRGRSPRLAAETLATVY